MFFKRYLALRWESSPLQENSPLVIHANSGRHTRNHFNPVLIQSSLPARLCNPMFLDLFRLVSMVIDIFVPSWIITLATHMLCVYQLRKMCLQPLRHTRLCQISQKSFSKIVDLLHTDGGTEYKPITDTFKIFTASHTFHHNPFGERINRTILEPARTILEEAGLERKYWSYAVEHVFYVKNRLPHLSLGCTPLELLNGKLPSLRHVRVFGCAAFAYNSASVSKFYAKAIPGIYLGVYNHCVYAIESIPYRCLLYSVYVTFDESSFPAQSQVESSSYDDNSVNNSSTHESYNSGALKPREIEIGILD